MAAVHPNIIKLRESRIPDYTHTTTLVKEGFAGISEEIKNQEYKRSGYAPRNYYLQYPDSALTKASPDDRRNVQRDTSEYTVLIAALVAKELRLSGASVIFVTLAGLIREINFNMLQREVTRMNPVMQYIGKGYIVIPDFAQLPHPAQTYSEREIHDVADYLTTHIGEGGGLVLAGRSPDSEAVLDYGPTLCKLLVRHFQRHVTARRSNV